MDDVRACYLCAKEIPIERRHSVFCTLRCEQQYQELERRAPPIEGKSESKTGDGRPREEWPGLGKTPMAAHPEPKKRNSETEPGRPREEWPGLGKTPMAAHPEPKRRIPEGS